MAAGGLKVPQKQPKRGRLWLNDGSYIPLRPQRKDHVWSYDMAMERTSDGRPLRILAVIDEFTRECLTLHVDRRIRSGDVLDQIYELFLSRGIPEYIRSDNGPEFAAKAVRKWLNRLDVTTLFIEPGSPWENGYVESFIGKMRDELLNGEVLDTLDEAKVLVEAWRKAYNRIRPHSSLGYRPPAPEAHMVGKFTQGLVHSCGAGQDSNGFGESQTAGYFISPMKYAYLPSSAGDGTVLNSDVLHRHLSKVRRSAGSDGPPRRGSPFHLGRSAH
jgi:putative transposase